MTKLAPEWVQTSDPVIRSTARYRWTTAPAERPSGRDWSDVMCFSCGKLGHAATRCPDFNESFPFLHPGWQKEKTPGGFIMIPPRVTMDRRRAENGDWSERGGGGGCLSGQGSCSGAGAVSTVSPQRMITDDVFQTVEQSGGGSPLITPGVLTEWTEKIMAEDTPGRECPHDDFEIRPQTGTIGISEDGVPFRNIEPPYGGGVRSLPGAAGNRLPVMFPTAHVSPANGPQLGSWRVAVMRVD